MTDPLEALAKRAEGEPFLLASLLAAFARSEGLDDGGLAAALGCPPGELTMVRLCRAPRADPREFWEDVRRICERFGADPRRLADAVKRGRVVRRLQGPPPAASGFLMAARDGEEPPPAEPPEVP
jgi:hypothetical protein